MAGMVVCMITSLINGFDNILSLYYGDLWSFLNTRKVPPGSLYAHTRCRHQRLARRQVGDLVCTRRSQAAATFYETPKK